MYKQPPFWVINSTLFLLFICMIIFVITTRYKLPSRTRLETPTAIEAPTKDVSKIDISQIYRNDLFNTYREMPVKEMQPEEKKLLLPPPPTLRPAAPVERKPVQFLEPLAITLKGIMYSSDEQYNRVIIEEKKSGKEKLYKVGDALEDAEIVRIYYNKVMLIRSNGQQETLFVTPQDAQKDPFYPHDIVWQNIVHQQSPATFTIQKDQFITAVRSLAEFIDMLDITTAFKKGKTVGCRIGVLKPQSAGQALGLQPNDIIISINNIPTISTNDRVAIFTAIKNMQPGSVIEVNILRGGAEIKQEYTLVPDTTSEQAAVPVQASASAIPPELQNMHEMSNKLVAESATIKNPMIEQIHSDNLSAMTTPTPSSILQQVPS